MSPAKYLDKMEDLEEGEIRDEKSPETKKHTRPLKLLETKKKYPPIHLAISKLQAKNSPNPYICKTHKKSTVDKEKEKINKQEKRLAKKEKSADMSCSKSFQDERTIKKVSPFRPLTNKRSRDFNHSTLNTNNSRTEIVHKDFDTNKHRNFVQNSSFGPTSYPRRYDGAFHSEKTDGPSYEELLDQYKSIQSELANLPLQTHSSRSATKSSEPNIPESKSLKRKRSASHSKPIKLHVVRKKNAVSLASKVASPAEQSYILEKKAADATKPHDDDYLELLRRDALAAFAKVPPLPVCAEAKNIENSASIPTADVLNLLFMEDNYEVVDMDVSNDEDEGTGEAENPLCDDSVVEIPREETIPELIDIDDNDDNEDDIDEEDEEILRARLILTLKQTKDKKVENSSEDNDTNANLIIVSAEAESSICSNDLSLDKEPSKSDFSENMPVSVQNTLENNLEAVGGIQSTSNLEDVPKEPSQVTVSDPLECAVASDTLTTDISKNMPNPEEIISNNEISKNICQNSHFENDVNSVVINDISSSVPVESVNKLIATETISDILVKMIPDSTVTKDDGINPQVQQTLSVTCRSDNLSSRKVCLTKRQAVPFLLQQPVKPLVIQFQKDSSESELDSDTEGPENPTLASLERLIETAKNKTEAAAAAAPPQEPNKIVACLPAQENRTVIEASVVVNSYRKTLAMAYKTYLEETQLCNKWKQIANKAKSTFITSQTEVMRLRNQLIIAEKVKNQNQKSMFTANARVSELQKSLLGRKESIKKMEADRLKVGNKS